MIGQDNVHQFWLKEPAKSSNDFLPLNLWGTSTIKSSNAFDNVTTPQIQSSQRNNKTLCCIQAICIGPSINKRPLKFFHQHCTHLLQETAFASAKMIKCTWKGMRTNDHKFNYGHSCYLYKFIVSTWLHVLPFRPSGHYYCL